MSETVDDLPIAQPRDRKIIVADIVSGDMDVNVYIGINKVIGWSLMVSPFEIEVDGKHVLRMVFHNFWDLARKTGEK